MVSGSVEEPLAPLPAPVLVPVPMLVPVPVLVAVAATGVVAAAAPVLLLCSDTSAACRSCASLANGLVPPLPWLLPGDDDAVELVVPASWKKPSGGGR